MFGLVKPGISISVALTTATGYLLAAGFFDIQVIYPTIGVLLMAMSASAFNQIIEKDTDKLMNRTRSRPLVSQTVTLNQAVITAILLAMAGFLTLSVFNSFVIATLALFNLLWYNLIYTPLKYKIAFAAFPGGLVGAIPPVLGWMAAGGHISDRTSIALAVFFFIGQIPHFWLIVLKYSSDYIQSGIISITQRFNYLQIKRLILMWVAATALSGSIFATIIILHNNLSFYLIQAFSALLLIYFLFWLNIKTNPKSNRSFILINVYYLLVMVILFLDII